MTGMTRRAALKLGSGALLAAALPGAAQGARAAKAPAHGWQFASASEIAAAIRARKISSLEVTRLILDRIEKLNPSINAIVTVTAEQALERARQADAALTKGVSWGPLHGVPCTVKDTFETKGTRTTAGAPMLKDYVPDHDALAVARLRAAGMVLVGKANTPIFAGDFQTYNELFGTTNNPWDLKRTPGGSTGGGAAAMAAGLGYLTIGSDEGGSLRQPAHFCGVFAHKPTLDVVPFRGHIPPRPGTPVNAMTLAVAGPMARSAADLALALRVMGGPLPEDASALAWHLAPPRRKSVRGMRIGYVLDDPLCPVSAPLRAPLAAAIDALRAAGARLEEGFPAGIDVKQQYIAYLDLMLIGDLAGASKETADALRALNPAADDLAAASFKRAVDATAAEYIAVLGKRDLARDAWQRYFRDHDAFITPVDFLPAFPHDHGEPEWNRVLVTPEGPRRYWDQLFWIALPSFTGLPATSAPVGLTAEGLPVGVQVMGPWQEDATPILVAGALESALGIRVPKGFE